MTFYVYMLINYQNNKITSYVGWTNSLKKRIVKHNSGAGAKFTRGRKWKLIYKKCYKTKSSALKNEYLLKKNYKERLRIKNEFLKTQNENINSTPI